jgi:uncharacterized membrane protein YkvA (DUF1232 family)
MMIKGSENPSGGPPPGFGKAASEAELISADNDKMDTLLIKATGKAYRQGKKLKRVMEDLQTLFRLVRSWKSGRYRSLPKRSIIFVIAAIIYFVNPIDLIPDPLPIAGFLDDASIIAFVIRVIKDDIQRFRDWEIAQL